MHCAWRAGCVAGALTAQSALLGPPTRTLGMVVIVSRDERGGMLLFRRRADVAPVAGVFAMSARRACMQVSREP